MSDAKALKMARSQVCKRVFVERVLGTKVMIHAEGMEGIEEVEGASAGRLRLAGAEERWVKLEDVRFLAFGQTPYEVID